MIEVYMVFLKASDTIVCSLEVRLIVIKNEELNMYLLMMSEPEENY